MNENLIEITIQGRQYTVNLEEAKKLGLIKEKKVKRPLLIKDVPNGSIFMIAGYGHDVQFVMLNNSIHCTGQLVWITGQRKGLSDCFGGEPSGISYFDYKTQTWISEIEES